MSETAAGVARVQDVVSDVMATHAARGSRLQTWLRLAVVVFVWACLLIVPPADQYLPINTSPGVAVSFSSPVACR